MTLTIERLFDQAAQTYDQNRRTLVPCFDDFYGTVLNLIPFDRAASINILDLGAGTGLLSALVGAAFPHAQVTLVDISDDMLNMARQRFAGQGARFRFERMDYARTPLSGSFHVVMSALSIHHLSESDKLSLFGQAYSVLEAGGIFINADQVLGETAAIDRHYHQIWWQKVQEKGISPAEVAAARERMKEDRCSTLAVQLAWLKQVGFEQVNCWYKNNLFAVFSGQKI
jgi:tRNA (cmo5U34)-methyltransferase